MSIYNVEAVNLVKNIFRVMNSQQIKLQNKQS